MSAATANAATTFKTTLAGALAVLDITLNADQQDLLYDHFVAMVEANTLVNLTRITDPAEAAVMLYADSLAPLAWMRQSNLNMANILDVGTGAGFPGIPLAVAMKDTQVTAIDSTTKKADFVEQIAYGMGLINFKAHSARAEHWHAPQPFDAIFLKAVGPVARCLEQCIRLAQPGTSVIMYKSAELPPDESAAAARTARKYAFDMQPMYRYQLPGDRNPRALHIYRKA